MPLWFYLTTSELDDAPPDVKEYRSRFRYPTCAEAYGANIWHTSVSQEALLGNLYEEQSGCPHTSFPTRTARSVASGRQAWPPSCAVLSAFDLDYGTGAHVVFCVFPGPLGCTRLITGPWTSPTRSGRPPGTSSPSSVTLCPPPGAASDLWYAVRYEKEIDSGCFVVWEAYRPLFSFTAWLSATNLGIRNFLFLFVVLY